MTKRQSIFLVLLCGLPGAVIADSLLTPTSFPKTVEDLNFAEHVELMQESYKPFEGLSPYDISLIINNDIAVDEQMKEEEPTPTNDKPITINPNKPKPPTQPVAPNTPGGRLCQQVNPKIPANQKIPLGEPVLNYNYNKPCSVYGPRGKYEDKTPYIHRGIDIGCNIEYLGKPVFVTADGIVKIVQKDNGKPAGNYIAIQHENGFLTRYMHLDTMLLSSSDVGKTVKAGCQIATVGHTGGNALTGATISENGSHLHYEIHYNGKYITRNGKKYFDLNGNMIELTYGREMNPKHVNDYSVNPLPFVQAGR